MDIFFEKLIARKKTIEDYMYIAGIFFSAIVAFFAVPYIPIANRLWLAAYAGIIYGAYYLITSRNIEYEYIVTNSDFDIDMIIAKRKRKRIFSANCKDFERVDRLDVDKLVRFKSEGRNFIHAYGSLRSPDLFYAALNYNGLKTVVIFEPDERILDAFKTYIPTKVSS